MSYQDVFVGDNDNRPQPCSCHKDDHHQTVPFPNGGTIVVGKKSFEGMYHEISALRSQNTELKRQVSALTAECRLRAGLL